jgi:hypothetical protein
MFLIFAVILDLLWLMSGAGPTLRPAKYKKIHRRGRRGRKGFLKKNVFLRELRELCGEFLFGFRPEGKLK